jgi:hypothetical protein
VHLALVLALEELRAKALILKLIVGDARGYLFEVLVDILLYKISG